MLAKVLLIRFAAFKTAVAERSGFGVTLFKRGMSQQRKQGSVTASGFGWAMENGARKKAMELKIKTPQYTWM